MSSFKTINLSVKDVSKMIGKSEETVRRLLRTEKIKVPTKPTSNKEGWIIPRESVLSFLRNNKEHVNHVVINEFVGSLGKFVVIVDISDDYYIKSHERLIEEITSEMKHSIMNCLNKIIIKE